jgi:glycerol-3-phosphate dehydrogenase
LHFGATLTEAEVRFAMATEWAETADDMLWRRSKLGLHLTPQQAEELAAFMRAERSAAATQRTAGAHA